MFKLVYIYILPYNATPDLNSSSYSTKATFLAPINLTSLFYNSIII